MQDHSARTAVVAGASGYIGRHVVEALSGRGMRVLTIGRDAPADATWDDPASLDRVLADADLLVNLAGRSVSCRYGKRNADEILASRIGTTAALGRALQRVASPSLLWINASTGTIYRDARDRPMGEADGEIGSGFSVEVARAWERELFDAPADVRKVALRMSIVLGSGGGAINPIINLARLGFGGRMGDGGQKVSWVHVDDVVGAVLHLVDHPEISGPVNVAAPEVVTNSELMAGVRAAMGRRVGLPEPAWVLEAGARIIRTEAELVLKSRWVASDVLMASGYSFVHETLESALDEIAARTPRGLLPVALG
ncbi:TIGR01777 family oxidoreductase [Aeromicrobium endophyticum]|uniref:TIGR01777 family protein n=1 Tax=Aeromicrobium endophyticum TaxID=2292704 RepID=A0A371P4F4_9ACTN|nr:TIGR01777 family oxidoreductase [Aeromicrobium endophyticum]REK70821.1 TIGR01777 family protein [Aeromicrobium endophyticum]